MPSWAAVGMSDAPQIIAYGIEHGGTTGPAVRDAIATMRGLSSALGGKLAMGTDTYTVVPSLALWRVQRGQLVKV